MTIAAPTPRHTWTAPRSRRQTHNHTSTRTYKRTKNKQHNNTTTQQQQQQQQQQKQQQLTKYKPTTLQTHIDTQEHDTQ